MPPGLGEEGARPVGVVAVFTQIPKMIQFLKSSFLADWARQRRKKRYGQKIFPQLGRDLFPAESIRAVRDKLAGSPFIPGGFGI